MSMTMGGSGDGPTDYSSFEYQQIVLTAAMEAADDDTASENEYMASVEPLDGIGGLANNEVAELVAHRITVTFNAEDPAEDGDQDVGGGFYLSGTFGANADDPDLVPSNYSDAGEFEYSGNTPGEPENSALRSVSEDRVFEQIQSSASIAFDDADGPGGSQDSNVTIFERNWRSDVGRGPVLDSSDDVTFAVLATAYDSVFDSAFEVQAHLIWDVAETDDAGRAFSVPS